MKRGGVKHLQPPPACAPLRAFLKVTSLAKMTLCCSARGGSQCKSDKPLVAFVDCPGQFRLGLGGEFTSLAFASQSSGPSLASALAKPPAQSFLVTEAELQPLLV